MLTWGNGRWEKERIGWVLQFVQRFVVSLKDFWKKKKWILFCKFCLSYSSIHQPAGGAVAHCATPTYLSFSYDVGKLLILSIFFGPLQPPPVGQWNRLKYTLHNTLGFLFVCLFVSLMTRSDSTQRQVVSSSCSRTMLQWEIHCICKLKNK